MKSFLIKDGTGNTWIAIDDASGLGALGETEQDARGRLREHLQETPGDVPGARPFEQIKLAHDMLGIWNDAPEMNAEQINAKFQALSIRAALCWILRHESANETVGGLLQFTYGRLTATGHKIGWEDVPIEDRPDLLDMFGAPGAPDIDPAEWEMGGEEE